MPSIGCLWFYLFILFSTSTCMAQSTQYFIKDGEIPSYLYKKFDQVKESTFPNYVTIQVALSRVTGTLLYSIDKNRNQLIVSLRDDIHNSDTPYALKVELNKQYIMVSLSKLCTCEGETFDSRSILTLRIIINTHIMLICNSGRVESFEIEGSRDLNMEYPILYSLNDAATKTKNEAHMWLVNHPELLGKYPNPDQMFGCIMNVYYNNRLLSFTNISNNIGNECKKTCHDNMCHGGQCHTFYGAKPVCNCTEAFRNGRLCNDTIQSRNFESTEQNFIFSRIKLSWKSEANELFVLKNNHLGLTLRRSLNDLFFEYKGILKADIPRSYNLSDKYVSNVESILIIYFNKDKIDFRLKNNDRWTRLLMPIDINLGTEEYNSVTLNSGDGVMDLCQKLNEDSLWETVYFIKTIDKKIVDDRPLRIGVPIGVSLIIMLLIAIIVYLVCRRYKKKKQKKIDIEKKYRKIYRKNDLPLDESECINPCLERIEWKIDGKCKFESMTDWIDFVNKEYSKKISPEHLKTMFNVIVRVTRRSNAYSKHLAILFVHARIRALSIDNMEIQIRLIPLKTEDTPSKVDEEELEPIIASSVKETNLNINTESLELLIELLDDKYKHSLSFNLKHSLVPMMIDFIEGIYRYRVNDETVTSLIESVLSFVAQCTVINEYKYGAAESILNQYLNHTDNTKVWATVILCHCSNDKKYLKDLREYLGAAVITTDEETHDAITVYWTMLRCVANNKDYKYSFTNADYQLFVAIHKDTFYIPWLKMDVIYNCIMRIFIDYYLDGILRNDKYNDQEELSIKFLTETLNKDLITNDNKTMIISMLHKLYGSVIKDNKAAINIVEKILDHLLRYARSYDVFMKEKIRRTCNKYLENDYLKDSLTRLFVNLKNYLRSKVIGAIDDTDGKRRDAKEQEIDNERQDEDTEVLPTKQRMDCDTIV